MTGHLAAAQGRLSRRQLLLGSGALIVAFGFGEAGPGRREATAGAVTALMAAAPSATPAATAGRTLALDEVDTFLAITPDNAVTVYSGKVELGTGVETALSQIAAEELGVAVSQVTVVMGDTTQTANQGYTAGSQTLQSAGPVLRRAAAQARQILLERAGKLFGVPVDQLQVRDGTITTTSGPTQSVTFGDLAGGAFDATIPEMVPTVPPKSYTIVGQSVPRVDIPPKIWAEFDYVQDVKLDGMLHGRVIRPYLRADVGIKTTLESLDESSVSDLPGLVKVVPKGNFVGVVAEREEQAIAAAKQLKVTWKTEGQLPAQADLFNQIRTLPVGQDKSITNVGDVATALNKAAKSLRATYQFPYQAHASIGPSCGVADVKADGATIYSATQGVYPLRDAIAELLGMQPEQVHVIYREGSGCYGHNGADDAAADAAVLSQVVGKPVRVQWMRQGEFAWEPKGPAMVIDVAGGLDGQGNVSAWDFAVWTPSHSTRPGGQKANLHAGHLIDPTATAKNGYAGGDRNAGNNYTFPNSRVVAHFQTGTFLHQSALRSLGAMANVFANESFMDELAAAAQADAVAFRLRLLKDPRAVEVVQRVAVLAKWQTRPSGPTQGGNKPVGSGKMTGRGVAFCQYETSLTYVGVVAEVEVDPASGQVKVTHVSVAHDCGQIVNPDGLRLQIEGNVIQGTSRALKEQVTFDRTAVTSLDWRGYQILTFPEVPQVDIDLIDRPEAPIWGAGEPTTCPMAAAIGNAIFDATGARLRTVPFTPDRVKAAMSQSKTQVGHP